MINRLGILVLLLPLLLLGVACQESDANKIRVAVAANMQLPMEAIVARYTEKYGVVCEMMIGSSGKLTAQIVEGAPYDVFVAANMKYPEAVYMAGKGMEAPRRYANGKLILWSVALSKPISVNTLNDPEINHIAMANPMTAPYGVAAMEVIEHYGLYDQLKHKLVYGESIAQTNQFIASKAADIGFTALSTVKAPRMKDKGRWLEVDAKQYSPITQGIVLIKRERENEQQLQHFYDFLFSEEVALLLKEFGYLMDE